MLKPGAIYSGELLTESNKRISERMGEFGYAFANVNANPEIDREKRSGIYLLRRSGQARLCAPMNVA
ncbi:hypothetical protein LP420_37775 [Massilia sp. B-10]|nr:hypothetical protein LP420_37775 [Massilia sp. B-10]